MKAWAKAANELKTQGKSKILDGFWPRIDSQDVISRHSPAKEKSDTKNAPRKEIEVEEENEWKDQTPVKDPEQEKRLASIEKAQEAQTSLVCTLSEALSKTRVECSTVLAKASVAIADSNRAVNALSKHLAALDEEIEAFEKIVSNGESAAGYLEAQVNKIAEHIAKLTNVPADQMEAMKKMLAETAAQLKSNEEEAKAGKAELMKVRAKRLKAGKEAEIANPKMMTHSNKGEATKLITDGQDQEMEEVRNKREREESSEEQGRAKRAASPVQEKQQGQKSEEEKTSAEKQTDEEGNAAMDDDL
jgi:hypothetical protein